MLSPFALLLLLPIGGAITLLYLLKQKRVETRVPSLLLWEQVTAQTANAAPFQKLRVDPLLLLQLLAALLLCLALARPFVWGDAVGGRTVVLVVDASASMNARDVPGGRLEAALVEARKRIAEKAPTDTFGVVLAGAQPLVLSPLTTDKAALLAALRSVAPTDAATAPREALILAASLAQSRPNARIVLLTDGAFARQEEVSLNGAAFETVAVGKRGANVGIVAFDVREKSEGNGYELFVSVRNADTAPRTVPLTLRAGTVLVDARELTVPPGETRTQALPLAPDDVPQGVDLLTATIESPDDLAADNEAFAALPPRQAVRILLVAGGDDPFLERALTLAPRAVVRHISPGAFTAKDAAESDITVFDGDTAPPADLPPGAYLFFGGVPTGKASPVLRAEGTMDAPPVLDFDRASPVLRFVNFGGVRVRLAQKIVPAPWASVLVESRAAPLLVGGEQAGYRVIYAAFRPNQSDLPLRVAFPVFVTNTVAHLSAQTGTDTTTRVLRPGDAASLPPGARLTDATGANATNTNRVGQYVVVGKNGVKTALGVSLLSDAETLTTPEASPPVLLARTSGDAAPQAKPRQSPREWWAWLAVPLLLLLCAEWWAFFRRGR